MGSIMITLKLARESVSMILQEKRDVLKLSVALTLMVVVRFALELAPEPDIPTTTVDRCVAVDLTPLIIFGGAESMARYSYGNKPGLVLLLKHEISVGLRCDPPEGQHRDRRCQVVIYRDPSERLCVEETAGEIRVSVNQADHHREMVVPNQRRAEWVALLDRVETPPNYPGKIDGTVYWVSPSPWFPPAPMAEEEQIPLDAWARFVLMKATAP